jgi:hydrogenase maturation factor HypE
MMRRIDKAVEEAMRKKEDVVKRLKKP